MLSRALLLCLFVLTSHLQAFTTQAKQAILMDAQTGHVLYEHNADELMPPSSLTKIVTAMIVFRELENGNLKEDDLLPVSQAAWKKGGSRMFIEVGTLVRVKDLLKGVIVQSGNDASIALAEGLYGNEAIFAAEMTRFSHSLGATKTTFRNATGWPDPTHLSTARDLAILSIALIKKYPKFYQEYFPMKEFTYNNIRQQNRNPLLYMPDLKSDGIKTGHTEAGGYGLVGTSISSDGTRLIVVVNGLKTRGERARESHALLKWGERMYKTFKVFGKGDRVLDANVWLGAEPQVPLLVAEDLLITIKRDAIKDVQVEVEYMEPINIARLQAGDQVGTVRIIAPDRDPISAPLIMSKTVEQAHFLKRIYSALYYIFLGHNQ